MVNLLLQILDEGRITDSLGRIVDFRNTIIIMTSNIGTNSISSTSFGFHDKKENNEENSYLNIMGEVKKYFIPEFLNRIDEIIVFNALRKDDLYKIIDLQLEDLRNNLKKKNNTLKITKTAKESLVRDGAHREWGARPLRRLIQNDIENTISAFFLSGKFIENGIITIKSKNKDLTFEQHTKKPQKSKKSKKKTSRSPKATQITDN